MADLTRQIWVEDHLTPGGIIYDEKDAFVGTTYLHMKLDRSNGLELA